jgi:hypothetical protein
VGALGKAFYKGGFEPRMNKREASLILSLRYVATLLFSVSPSVDHISPHPATCGVSSWPPGDCLGSLDWTGGDGEGGGRGGKRGEGDGVTHSQTTRRDC